MKKLTDITQEGMIKDVEKELSGLKEEVVYEILGTFGETTDLERALKEKGYTFEIRTTSTNIVLTKGNEEVRYKRYKISKEK